MIFYAPKRYLFFCLRSLRSRLRFSRILIEIWLKHAWYKLFTSCWLFQDHAKSVNVTESNYFVIIFCNELLLVLFQQVKCQTSNVRNYLSEISRTIRATVMTGLKVL